MTPIARAVFRALISLLHPRMMWLAIWPFLLAIVFWGVSGWMALGVMLPMLHDALFGLTLIHWVEGTFQWLHLGWLLEFLVPLAYLALLLSLAVATALAIFGLLGMPIVVDHVASRHHPTLERRHGATVWGSLANVALALLIFLVGWIVTMPLWLVFPLAILVPWLWWGWLAYRILVFDALALHASPEERLRLIDEERPRLILLGVVVAAMNFVPPLFFVAPIYGGLVFTHYGLEALERLRRGPETVAPRAPADAIGRMTMENGV